MTDHKGFKLTKLDADVPAIKLTTISGYLDDWENAGHDDKRQVTDS